MEGISVCAEDDVLLLVNEEGETCQLNLSFGHCTWRGYHRERDSANCPLRTDRLIPLPKVSRLFEASNNKYCIGLFVLKEKYSVTVLKREEVKISETSLKKS